MENELEIARLSREIYALSRRVAELESAQQNQSAVIAAGDIEAIERRIDLRHARYDPE
jgi:hypothetical protein